jgi:hypothetical protein
MPNPEFKVIFDIGPFDTFDEVASAFSRLLLRGVTRKV